MGTVQYFYVFDVIKINVKVNCMFNAINSRTYFSNFISCLQRAGRSGPDSPQYWKLYRQADG